MMFTIASRRAVDTARAGQTRIFASIAGSAVALVLMAGAAHATQKHTGSPKISAGPVVQRILATGRTDTVRAAALSAKAGAGNMSKDREADLRARKAELEARLREAQERFLESEDGENARDRVGEEQDKRREAEREMRRRQAELEHQAGQNCCGRGERLFGADWVLDEQERIANAYNGAVDEILEEEMQANDPQALKEYRGLKAEIEQTRADIRQARANRAAAGANTGASAGGVVQPK